jgi:hypothetical protein
MARLHARHELAILVDVRIRTASPEAVDDVVVVLRRRLEVSALADVLFDYRLV